VGDELARALERRSLRVRQAGISAGAAILAVLARHASADVQVTAVAAAAGVITFLIAVAVAHRDVLERALDARAVAPPRRVRSVARALERLALLAERGAAEPRQTRPPCWVLELAPEADAIRELVALLRAHPEAPMSALAACDRFVFHCWNARLRGLDHELLRRELGRVRFALAGVAAGSARGRSELDQPAR
jgi:hypothetical protein